MAGLHKKARIKLITRSNGAILVMRWKQKLLTKDNIETTSLRSKNSIRVAALFSNNSFKSPSLCSKDETNSVGRDGSPYRFFRDVLTHLCNKLGAVLFRDCVPEKESSSRSSVLRNTRGPCRKDFGNSRSQTRHQSPPFIRFKKPQEHSYAKTSFQRYHEKISSSRSQGSSKTSKRQVSYGLSVKCVCRRKWFKTWFKLQTMGSFVSSTKMTSRKQSRGSNGEKKTRHRTDAAEMDSLVNLQNVRVPEIASTANIYPSLHQSSAQYDVYIGCCEQDSSSVQLALKLLKDLESRSFSCIFGDRDFLPGDVISEAIFDAVTSSRHVILVLTRNSCSGWCNFRLFVTLWRMVESNRVNLIPLLVDLSETEVPPCLKNIACINTRTDPNHMEKLLSMLTGPEVTVRDLLPAGNVSHGLMWSYYLNYLKDILPGINDRIDRWCEQEVNKNCLDLHMPRRFYILVPASCFCPRGLDLADRSCLSFGGHLDDVVADRAGCTKRVYRHTVWNITRPGKQTLQFVGEYATVVHTLYQMESVRNAGLDSRQRQAQTQNFVYSLSAVLAQNGHDNAEVIFFEDTDGDGNQVPLSHILSPRVEADRVASLGSWQTASISTAQSQNGLS